MSNFKLKQTGEQVQKAIDYAMQVPQLSEAIADIASGGLDETALKEYLEENSQNIGILTINGQEYNGSRDVNIVIETSSGSSGGGGSETASEEQLATGYIDAETYPTINVNVETGVTLADLKKYKRFYIKQKGKSNTALENFYFKLDGKNIFRNSTAGAEIYYEWLDGDRTLLKITDYWFGNPSLLAAVGTQIITKAFAWPVRNIASAYTGIQGIFDFSEVEDDATVCVCSGTIPTITYNWEIRGLTV